MNFIVLSGGRILKVGVLDGHTKNKFFKCTFFKNNVLNINKPCKTCERVILMYLYQFQSVEKVVFLTAKRLFCFTSNLQQAVLCIHYINIHPKTITEACTLNFFTSRATSRKHSLCFNTVIYLTLI